MATTAGRLQWCALDSGERAELDGHESAINTVRWNHDGRVVVTAGYDGAVLVWDPRGGLSLDAFPATAGRCGART
ncbi:MAG: WD40 repeat domain-containing protein [Egibacteraceae bacterium]